MTIFFLLLAVYHCEAGIEDIIGIPGKIFKTFFDVFSQRPEERGINQRIADKQGSDNYNQNLNLNGNTGNINLDSKGVERKQNYGNLLGRPKP